MSFPQHILDYYTMEDPKADLGRAITVDPWVAEMILTKHPELIHSEYLFNKNRRSLLLLECISKSKYIYLQKAQ